MKLLKCENCNGDLNPTVGAGRVLTCEYCNTANVLANADSRLLPHHQLVEVMYEMRRRFNLNDLKNVCAVIALNTNNHAFAYESISGDVLSGKCRELLLASKRYGLTWYLLKVLSDENREFALWLENLD